MNRWLDRLLVAFGGLMLLVLAIASALWLIKGALSELFLSWLAALRETESSYWTMWILTAFYLLFGVVLIWIAFRRPRRNSGVFQVNDLGTLTITSEAVENLVQQALSQVRGVYTQTLRVKTNEAGELQVSIVLNADGERDFPGLVEDVQTRVKYRVEEITGVNVSDVHVEIQKIQSRPPSPVTKPRVE